MYTTLLTNNENGIFTITINRPEKLNALNGQVIAELEAVMHEVYTNPAIKSVLLAGADISEFIGAGSAGGKTLARRGQDLFFKIENCPKVVIACVNGFALGGGCELAMACHFRIASENAKFGQPEVNLGIMPGYGGTQRLVQLIGKGRALELMLTGGMIDASAAFASGLVNHVVMPDQLLTKAKEIATLIQSKAPVAVAKCIEAANAVHNEALNGYETELNAFSACFDTTDMIEGTTAFLEKRKPVFTGK
jgi:enoyl-CoA hydratase